MRLLMRVLGVRNPRQVGIRSDSSSHDPSSLLSQNPSGSTRKQWLRAMGWLGWGAWMATIVTVWNWDVVLRGTRRVMNEGRIPLLSAQFEQNRHYVLRRRLFATYPGTELDLCVVGDSIMAYPAWHEYFRSRVVAVRAIEGDSSDGLLSRVNDLVELAPASVLIQIGINDIRRGESVRNVASRILRTVSILLDRGLGVGVIGLLPVGREVGSYAEINDLVAATNALLLEGACTLGVPITDLSMQLAPKGFLDPRYTYDGIHLTADAYAILAREMEFLLRRIEHKQRTQAVP